MNKEKTLKMAYYIIIMKFSNYQEKPSSKYITHKYINGMDQWKKSLIYLFYLIYFMDKVFKYDQIRP